MLSSYIAQIGSFSAGTIYHDDMKLAMRGEKEDGSFNRPDGSGTGFHFLFCLADNVPTAERNFRPGCADAVRFRLYSSRHAGDASAAAGGRTAGRVHCGLFGFCSESGGEWRMSDLYRAGPDPLEQRSLAGGEGAGLVCVRVQAGTGGDDGRMKTRRRACGRLSSEIHYH